jgi:FkbM family methyltransferase
MTGAPSDHNPPVEIAVGHGRSIHMLDCGGRDQIVRACMAGGWRALERPMPEIFYSSVQATDGAVVDVGANTGFYTLLAAVARPGSVLWAFEPDPQVRPILEENLRLNHLTHRAILFAEALSDRPGIASLYLPTKEHGCVETSSSLESSFKSSHAEVLPVAVNTLDARVAASMSGRIGIIKIDVEGHEAAVLAGASTTVQSHQPWIFVEVLPGADFGALHEFLDRHCYVAIALHPAGPGHPTQAIAFVENAWNHLLLPIAEAGAVLASLNAMAGSEPRPNPSA